jgi:hypothetical protein
MSRPPARAAHRLHCMTTARLTKRISRVLRLDKHQRKAFLARTFSARDFWPFLQFRSVLIDADGQDRLS